MTTKPMTYMIKNTKVTVQMYQFKIIFAVNQYNWVH